MNCLSSVVFVLCRRIKAAIDLFRQATAQRSTFFTCFFWLLFAAPAMPSAAADLAVDKPAVQRTLRVVLDDNYPPYVFRDADGTLSGYLVDSWKLWEEKTGVRVELLASDWEIALQRMAARQADVIDTIFQTSERDQKLDFTAAYAQIPVAIYTHVGIGGITNLKTLQGFLVGVKAGDACAETLAEAGITSLQRYASYESLVQAAVAQQVKVFCLDVLPANYLLYRAHADRDFNKAFELHSGEFHRAVHKGDAETLALVESGFSAITATEEKGLRDKWMGSSLNLSAYSRYLGYALLLAVLVGGLLALWGATLRRTVRQRTAQLESQGARLRTLVQTIPDLVWLKDKDGVYVACNPMFELFFGAKEADIVGKTDYDFVAKELADFFRENDRNAAIAGKPSSNEEQLTIRATGYSGLFETIKTPIFDANGELVGVLGIARDISVRKQMEDALRLSEQKFSAAFRSSPDAIIISAAADGRIVDVNEAFIRLASFSREEMIGSSGIDLSLWIDPDIRDYCFSQLHDHGRVVDKEANFRIKTGETRVGLICAEVIEIDSQPHILWVIRDITERKLAEAKILRLTQLYAALSQCNQAIVRCSSEEELFQKICHDAVHFGGMKMAWIGMIDAASQVLSKVAAYGDDADYLANIEIALDDDSLFGRGPTGTAVREDRPFWCEDFANDPITAPWRELGAGSHWVASAALPLHRNGVVIGALSLYAGDADAFDVAGRKLLLEMALDIDFALDNFIREAARKEAEIALRVATQSYSELVERIPIGVYKLRMEAAGSMHFDYASPRFYSMIGRNAEAVLGDFTQAFSAVHPAEREEFIRQNLEAQKTLQPFFWEGRFIVDDRERWMCIESQPFLQKNGDILWEGVQIDVTERRQAENELAAANQRLLALSGRLLQVQEEERRTLARELHDEIGQALTALKITLQSLGMRPETAALQKQINMAIGITDTALKQARQMSLDLRPAQLDDLGLPAAIRWNLERQCHLAGLVSRFSAEDLPIKISEPIAIACYRISQEAITNVIKHAHAGEISIRLAVSNDQLCLEIGDDGQGFDLAAISGGSGMGMVSMQERAALAGGRLEIDTQPSRGCVVRAFFLLSLQQP